MARSKGGVDTVNPNEMDLDHLQDHEARWLQDHCMLPDDYEKQPVFFNLPDGTQVTNDPAAMQQAGQQLLEASQDDDGSQLQAYIEARAQEIAAELATQAQAAATAVGDENHGNANNEPAKGAKITPTPSHDELPEEEESEEDEDSEEGDEEESYDSMKNDDLRAELSRRGLSVEGNKAEMISRLEADDGEE